MSKLHESKLCMLLETFINGENRSLNFAGEIESAFAETFPDDERFEDLMYMLASYRPGGGEFLYNEEQLKKECERVLRILRE
ncbi:MAG: hypothetical protein PVH61_44195 [Candidatus Aminicenantes bacterium]